jgi:uncharacterized protein
MKSYLTRILLLLVLLQVNLLAKDFFWEVNGTQGGKVYLLASLPMGQQDLYPLSSTITDAFQKSNYLFLQHHRNDNNAIYTNEELYKKGRLEDNDTLSNHLSEESYEQLQSWLTRLKLSKTSMDRYHPWVVALTLSSLDIASNGNEERLTLQSYFFKKAQRNNKRIYSLERVSDHLMRMKDEDPIFQENLLQTYMYSSEILSESVEKTFMKCKEGNVSFFEESLLHPFEAFPLVKERVLSEANEKFMKKVLRYRGNKKGRSYFIIIGLEYLLGDTGILARLKEAEIEVVSH